MCEGAAYSDMEKNDYGFVCKSADSTYVYPSFQNYVHAIQKCMFSSDLVNIFILMNTSSKNCGCLYRHPLLK